MPLIAGAGAAWGGDAPTVVATIAPVHSLAAEVMAGVGTPVLLVPGGRSPHDYALRPTDARALESAAVVIWVGPSLETWMKRPLRTLAAGAAIVTLENAPGLIRLAPRTGGAWQMADGHDHAHGDELSAPGALIDPHIWLSTRNAGAAVEAIAAALAVRDPANADTYRRNARATTLRIGALETELAATLAPVKQVPFIVFHDAFQYFDHQFGLAAAGAVATGPERLPGARRIAELRHAIRARDARCVFREPQFSSALANTVREGTGARDGVLDDLGADLPAGPDQWFTLMRNLGQSMRACLAEGR